MNTKEQPDIMTAHEVAEYLRLDGEDRSQQLQRLRSRGLPFVRLGRSCVYPKSMVAKWVEDQSKVPT